MPKLSEKILVRGLNWLGDSVMSTPALMRLRQARPSAHVTLLAPEKLAGLWQDQPFLNEVLAFSPAETAWQVGRRLRRGNFTEAVALPNSIRSALELWLAGIPRRVGVARPGRGFFLTKALPPRPDAVPMRRRSSHEIRHLIARDTPATLPPPAAHHVHDYLYLTAELGGSPEPLPPRIVINDEEAAQLCQKLRLETAPPGRPWFGLCPGAEYGPAKRWLARRFVASAVLLQKQHHCRWLVFGGRGDVDLAEKITTEIRYVAREADGVINLAGKTNLRELAAALKLCRLLLTNDTGPMHLAAALGTPLIVPFGSTSPELTGPFCSPNAEIMRAPVPCAPCFRRECPIDLRCFSGVETAQVIEAARRLLHPSS
ncbi:MAG: lipopolysaccharide heptosyltransferase II [Verrucomicrobiota bacterium]|jgi:heptosyltransferase-2